MAFSNSFLEQIKDRVSLSSVVSKYVVWDNKKSSQSKRDFWAPCPFHAEKTASFHVNDNKGFYYCFGCQTTGNVFSFLKEKEGLSFQDAVKTLSEKAGLEHQLRLQTQSGHKFPDEKIVLQEELIKIHHVASKFFNEALFSPQGLHALSYLKDRGLSKQTIEAYQIGYASKDSSVLSKFLVEKGFTQEKISQSGLSIVSEGNSYFDRFRDRIIFPIFNARNKIVAFGGRALKEGLGAKYLNSPETEIFKKGSLMFNLNNVRKYLKGDDLIIVEGYMDVISLSNALINTSVAPLGTALSEKQLQLIWEVCSEPTLLFDGDKAGLAATNRAIELALPFLTHNKTLRIARPKDYCDPDDVLKLEGRDAIFSLLKSSKSIVDFIFEREMNRKPIDSPERSRKLEIDLRKEAFKIRDIEIRKLFFSQFESKLRNLRFFSKVNTGKSNKIKKHIYEDLKAQKTDVIKISEEELVKIEAGIVYCLAKNQNIINDLKTKLSELDFQHSIFKNFFWQMQNSIETKLSDEMLSEIELRTIQKDPLLKRHLIFNNIKEEKKSKKLLLNSISIHNMALNRLERLKDLKIKLKTPIGESVTDSESLGEIQNNYHKAISGDKYIKEEIAKEKESHRDNLEQLSNRIKRKNSEE